jgi:hypothetical protein
MLMIKIFDQISLFLDTEEASELVDILLKVGISPDFDRYIPSGRMFQMGIVDNQKHL